VFSALNLPYGDTVSLMGEGGEGERCVCVCGGGGGSDRQPCFQRSG
jgi:hypothetical protein